MKALFSRAVLGAIARRALVFGAFGLALNAQEPFPQTMVPLTAYVGDRARLIVPLDASLLNSVQRSVVIEAAASLPRTLDVVIRRVELERRPDAIRALIDFTAFVPGDVPLPIIEIGPVRLEGLRVRISSVLAAEDGNLELSPAEDPLAAPGTAFLIFGGIALLALGAAGSIAFFVRGVPFVRSLSARYRSRRVLRAMRTVIRRWSARLDKAGASGFDATSFFGETSRGLRAYLSDRSGVDCRAFTGAEFQPGILPDRIFVDADIRFLRGFFRRGDGVRFGNEGIDPHECRSALDVIAAMVERVC